MEQMKGYLAKYERLEEMNLILEQASTKGLCADETKYFKKY